MKTATVVILALATVLASAAYAEKVVVYKTSNGDIVSFHDAGTEFPSGLKSGLNWGTSETAAGTETNISQIADLVADDGKDLEDYINDLADVLTDETLTKQEKRDAARVISAKIKAKTQKK